MMRNAVHAPWAIFDVDGTLSDASHRLHHIKEVDRTTGNFLPGRKEKPDWDAYNSLMHLDLPRADIIYLNQMAYTDGLNIAIVTGRQERYRKETDEWLKKHKIYFDKMFMRPTADHRSDFVIKEEIYDVHFSTSQVLFVVEDRQAVVNMWRRKGITCLQCQEGDF